MFYFYTGGVDAIDSSSEKVKLDLSMDDPWPLFTAQLFHWFDRYLKGGYAGLLENAATSTVPLTVLVRTAESVVVRIFRMVFILLFVRFLVPVSGSGVSLINNGLWVGILAFEGTTALGYIALVPWLAKVSMRGTLALLAGGLRSELIVFKTDEKQMTLEDFERAGEREITEDRAASKIIAGPIVHGGLLLFGVLFIMLLGIWLTSQWKVAALCVSVYWLGSLLQGLIVPAALAYSDLALSMYNHVKAEHENIKNICPLCLGSTEHSVSNNFATRYGQGARKAFFWIICLVTVIWITCTPNSHGEYVSSQWTWILLFVPVYFSIFRFIFRFLRRLFRKLRVPA